MRTSFFSIRPIRRNGSIGLSLDVLGAAATPGLVVVQHSKRLALAEEYGALRRTRMVKQSDNALSFFRTYGVGAGAGGGGGGVALPGAFGVVAGVVAPPMGVPGAGVRLRNRAAAYAWGPS